MNTTLAKNKTRTKVQESSAVNSAADVAGKGILSVMTGATVLIALWAAASMVTALVSAGPVGLIKSWFSAVVGM